MRRTKALILLLLFFLITVSCKSSYIPEDSFSQRNLKGEIKSIKEVAFDIKNITDEGNLRNNRLADYIPDNEEEVVYRNAIVTYNKNGTRNEFLKTSISDSVISKKVYGYNKKGNLNQFKLYKKPINTTISYINGKKKQTESFGSFKLIEGSIYTYDKKNLTEEENMLIRNNNFENTFYLNWKKYYEYDSSDLLRKVYTLDASKDTLSLTILEYDDNDNLISKHREGVRQRTNKTDYKYDVQNNLVQKAYYIFGVDLENNLAKKTYYNYIDNTLEYAIVIDFREKTTTVHFFNSKILITKSCVTNSIIDQPNYKECIGYLTYNYEFVYDNNGNWIRKIKYFNGRPNIMMERIIEYWE